MAISRNAPLPVQERAWNTRERILAAAVACLAEDGYAATTTSRIQERAGVSRGSLLHQFPSRDDVLIAAVQHLARQRADQVDVPKAAGTIDDAVEQIWLTFQGPLFRAVLQLWAAAQHNPQLAEVLRPQEHEMGRHIRQLITGLFGPEHVAHPDFPTLAPVLLASMRGAALTYTFEPRDHTKDPMLAAWKRLAHRILDSPR